MLTAGQSSCYSSFQMTVEINYVIAIAIVIGLKILRQLFSQREPQLVRAIFPEL